MGILVQLELLLANGALVVEARSDDKRTPLHFASHCAHIDTIELLLNSGHSAQVIDESKNTPLHVAIWNQGPPRGPPYCCSEDTSG